VIDCVISDALRHFWFITPFLIDCVISDSLRHFWFTASFLIHCTISDLLRHFSFIASFLIHCVISDWLHRFWVIASFLIHYTISDWLRHFGFIASFLIYCVISHSLRHFWFIAGLSSKSRPSSSALPSRQEELTLYGSFFWFQYIDATELQKIKDDDDSDRCNWIHEDYPLEKTWKLAITRTLDSIRLGAI